MLELKSTTELFKSDADGGTEDWSVPHPDTASWARRQPALDDLLPKAWDDEEDDLLDDDDEEEEDEDFTDDDEEDEFDDEEEDDEEEEEEDE